MTSAALVTEDGLGDISIGEENYQCEKIQPSLLVSLASLSPAHQDDAGNPRVQAMEHPITPRAQHLLNGVKQHFILHI